MKGINLQFVNNLPYGSRLFADGKEIRVKRNSRGTSEVFVETDKETAEIQVKNLFEGQLPFWKWFLITFTCWIISVFGIFDSVSNNKGRTVDVNFNVKPEENAFVKIKFNLYKKDTPAMQIVETNTEVNEVSNIYKIDKQAQKRSRFYKVWRILSVIAVVIITVTIISLRS